MDDEGFFMNDEPLAIVSPKVQAKAVKKASKQLKSTARKIKKKISQGIVVDGFTLPLRRYKESDRRYSISLESSGEIIRPGECYIGYGNYNIANKLDQDDLNPGQPNVSISEKIWIMLYHFMRLEGDKPLVNDIHLEEGRSIDSIVRQFDMQRVQMLETLKSSGASDEVTKPWIDMHVRNYLAHRDIKYIQDVASSVTLFLSMDKAKERDKNVLEKVGSFFSHPLSAHMRSDHGYDIWKVIRRAQLMDGRLVSTDIRAITPSKRKPSYKKEMRTACSTIADMIGSEYKDRINVVLVPTEREARYLQKTLGSIPSRVIQIAENYRPKHTLVVHPRLL